jgi:hypothetical protein
VAVRTIDVDSRRSSVFDGGENTRPRHSAKNTSFVQADLNTLREFRREWRARPLFGPAFKHPSALVSNQMSEGMIGIADRD